MNETAKPAICIGDAMIERTRGGQATGFATALSEPGRA